MSYYTTAGVVRIFLSQQTSSLHLDVLHADAHVLERKRARLQHALAQGRADQVAQVGGDGVDAALEAEGLELRALEPVLGAGHVVMHVARVAHCRVGCVVCGGDEREW